MEEIILSIIIPIYNAEKYLNECIKSICNQEIKNIEIILINDGSTDKSHKICEKYVKIDSRIVYIKNKNQGCSITRNLGINIAKGKYITFVDSDDWYTSTQFLKDIIQKMELNKIEILVFGIERIFKNGKREQILPIEIKDKKKIYDQKKIFNSPCNKIYLKSLIKEQNIYFPEKSHMGEDMIFNLKVLYFVEKIHIVEKIYYFYRNHDESVSYKLEKAFDIYIAFNDLIDYFFLKNIKIEKYNKTIYSFFKEHGIKKTYVTLINMKLNKHNDSEINNKVDLVRNMIKIIENRIKIKTFKEKYFYEILLKLYFLKPLLKIIKIKYQIKKKERLIR